MVEPTREQVDDALADVMATVEDPHEYATVGEHLDYWKDVARVAAAEVVRLRATAQRRRTGWTVDRSGRLVYNARQAVAGAPWCDDLIIAGDHRQGAAYIGTEAHAALVELVEPARVAVVALGPPVPEAPEATDGG